MIPVLLYGVVLISIILLVIVSIYLPSISSALFLMAQFTFNSSLIFLLCFLFGVIKTKLDPSHFLVQYFYIILPVTIIIVMWVKSLIIYMDNLQQRCKNETITDKVPYRFDLVVWNTSKIAISILIVYLITNFFSAFTVPFYELFDSDDEIMSVIAIGVWLGCATWPSEASCYFNLLSDGCLPSQQITFNSNLTQQGLSVTEDF